MKTTKLASLLTASCLALAPAALAVDPPPDGGYANANTAEGDNALFSLTSGANNSAVGFNALFNNTTGNYNTSTGFYSLANNTTGNNNTATGDFALQSNGTGTDNTAIGFNALFGNTSGRNNIALGAAAGFNLTAGNNNIDIGNQGAAGESSTIRIGTRGTHKSVHVAGISGVTVAGGVNVIVDNSGHLGTVTSSARYKEAIKPMAKASEALLALEPVTFRYKKELDPACIPQFGLVAEQVAKIDPNLVARDESGKPYTVRYEAVNAMLLNEFLKEHRKVEELEKAMAKLRATIEKVSARIETQRPPPRLVEDR